MFAYWNNFELDENNFTSRVWWALIEDIVQRAEEMAGKKKMACCVRGYHVFYTRIYGMKMKISGYTVLKDYYR